MADLDSYPAAFAADYRNDYEEHDWTPESAFRDWVLCIRQDLRDHLDDLTSHERIAYIRALEHPEAVRIIAEFEARSARYRAEADARRPHIEAMNAKHSADHAAAKEAARERLAEFDRVNRAHYAAMAAAKAEGGTQVGV